MSEPVTPREFDLAEKLNAVRDSTVHLRIAAVEAQAARDREAQAAVNARLSEQITDVKTGMSDLKSSTNQGFADIKVGMLVIFILSALVAVANLPGLWAIIKGKVP